MKKILILMATYNGEEYISEQINSIINQTYKNWELYIHDDGSHDNTKKIIDKYSKTDKRIRIVGDNLYFKNPKKNFLYLVEFIKKMKYDYVAFCDQDDIWKENKLEIILASIEKLSSDIPCLVHSDSMIIDKEDKVLSKSFDDLSGMQMKRDDFESISLWNNAQGCSIIVNKKCIQYIDDVNSDKIIMHDWLITMICSLFGKCVYLDNPLIMYREHNSNCIGPNTEKKFKDVISKKDDYRKKTLETYERVYEQLNYFLEKYHDKMDSIQISRVEKELDCFNKGKITRFFYCINKKLLKKKGIKSCLGFIFFGGIANG